MKKYEITYRVEGVYTEVIEVEDDATIEEIEEMCYNNFPTIEEYYVEVYELESHSLEDEDDEQDDDDEDDDDEDEEEA